jgi:hypothetical protein
MWVFLNKIETIQRATQARTEQCRDSIPAAVLGHSQKASRRQFVVADP